MDNKYTEFIMFRDFNEIICLGMGGSYSEIAKDKLFKAYDLYLYQRSLNSIKECIEAMPTTTEAEIRNKAIDDFIRGLKNHPHAQYHLDNYLLEDIDQTAKWLKEE